MLSTPARSLAPSPSSAPSSGSAPSRTRLFSRAVERPRCLLSRLVVVAAALLAASCVTDRAPIRWEAWRETYPAGDYATPLAEKAQRIDRHLVSHHLAARGVLVYSRRCDLPGDPDTIYDNVADQTIWTGALVAVRTFEYRLSGAAGDRARLLEVLRGLALLHDVTGKPGLFSRAVFPVGRPLRGEKASQEWRPGAPPYDVFRYRGDVSKDQYFGVLFGYAAVVSELGIDATSGDPEIRALVAGPAVAVADHIWENGLSIVDVDGETTKHGDLAGHILCIPIGPNAQLDLGFQLLASRVSGLPRFRERYDELLARGYAEATGNVKFEIFGKTNHNNDNMGMMGLWALAALEQEPGVRARFDRALAGLWGVTRHEGNSFFHAICASRFELPRFARFDLVENLRLFPVAPEVHGVDVRGLPGVERAFFKSRFGRVQNTTALPVHLRPRSSFVWTRSPFELEFAVAEPGARCVAGVDYLLAYWMARRYLGDVEAVERTPPPLAERDGHLVRLVSRVSEPR